MAAVLSYETYARLTAFGDDAHLMFLNDKGETHKSDEIKFLGKTKTRVNLKFNFDSDSGNIHPFDKVALVVKNRVEVISNITPVEGVESGTISIDYEWENN